MEGGLTSPKGNGEWARMSEVDKRQLRLLLCLSETEQIKSVLFIGMKDACCAHRVATQLTMAFDDGGWKKGPKICFKPSVVKVFKFGSCLHGCFGPCVLVWVLTAVCTCININIKSGETEDTEGASPHWWRDIKKILRKHLQPFT